MSDLLFDYDLTLTTYMYIQKYINMKIRIINEQKKS